MNNRVLIFGASGFIGNAIRSDLLGTQYEVFGTYGEKGGALFSDTCMTQMDLSDTSGLERLLEKSDPRVVISSIRGPFEKQLAFHRQLSGLLSGAPETKLFFLSSSSVFDGDCSAPHMESDVPCARSDCGNFKIQCESLLLERLGSRCSILRLPQVWGNNCPRIHALKNAVREGSTINSNPRLFLNAATTTQIIAFIKYILQTGLSGVFHVGSADMIDQDQLLRELCACPGFGKPVLRPVSSSEEEYRVLFSQRGEIPSGLKPTVQEIVHAVCMA